MYDTYILSAVQKIIAKLVAAFSLFSKIIVKTFGETKKFHVSLC